MTPQAYRPVILMALKEAQLTKPRNLEDLTDRIIGKMAVFEEMVVAAGVIAPAPPPSSIAFNLPPNTATTSKVLNITQVIAARPAERIVPVETQVFSDDEVIERKQAVLEVYRKELPQSIRVQPQGFQTPIALSLLGYQNSPGGMPFVMVKYGPPGAGGEHEIVTIGQSVSGDVMSSEALVEAVKEQAIAKYLAAPRIIAPVIPAPLDFSDTRDVPHADTDEGMSEADQLAWNRAVGRG